jgi:predicted metal-dependent hydrolase
MGLVDSNSCKVLYFKDIGEIKLLKNSRVNRLSIKVKPFDGVIVSIPNRVSYKQAEDFVFQKTDWIKKSLQRMEKYEDKLSIFDEKSSFKTKKHQLYIEKWDKETISVRVLNWKIMVKYPEQMFVRDEKIQKLIRKGIERALTIEAEEFLPVRIKQISNQLGFKYKSLTAKNGKTRWGSCTSDNRINLNIHLMRLPDHLVDYVIVHELCHTIQKNHGPKFWDLMEKVFPKSKIFDKELKNHQTKVY